MTLKLNTIYVSIKGDLFILKASLRSVKRKFKLVSKFYGENLFSYFVPPACVIRNFCPFLCPGYKLLIPCQFSVSNGGGPTVSETGYEVLTVINVLPFSYFLSLTCIIEIKVK